MDEEEYEAMATLEERAAIERANVEIGKALAFASGEHSQAEHIGALMGEMDWRSEKARLLGEPVMKLHPASPKVDTGGFGY